MTRVNRLAVAPAFVPSSAMAWNTASIARLAMALAGGLYVLAAAGPTAAAERKQATDEARARDYVACMELARRAPAEGLARAETMWKSGAGVPARHCVATALLAMGRSAQAAKVLSDLARDMDKDQQSQRADLHAQAGRAWLDAGNAARAEKSFAAAVAAAPDDAALLINRAVALSALGRDWDALDDLNRAVELAPASADARVLRAAAWRRLGTPDLARQDLEAALTLDPSSADAWLEWGLLHEKAGEVEAARRAFEKAAAFDRVGATAAAARAALGRLAPAQPSSGLSR